MQREWIDWHLRHDAVRRKEIYDGRFLVNYPAGVLCAIAGQERLGDGCEEINGKILLFGVSTQKTGVVWQRRK